MSPRLLAFLMIQEHCIKLWFRRTDGRHRRKGEYVRCRRVDDARRNAYSALSVREREICRLAATDQPKEKP